MLGVLAVCGKFGAAANLTISRLQYENKGLRTASTAQFMVQFPAKFVFFNASAGIVRPTLPDNRAFAT